jgi:hypothetical protein
MRRHAPRSQDARFPARESIMGHTRQSGFVLGGAMLLAAMSVLALVAGCHATATHAGAAVARTAQVAPPARAPDIAEERPFDEMFYVLPQEDAAPQN